MDERYVVIDDLAKQPWPVVRLRFGVRAGISVSAKDDTTTS